MPPRSDKASLAEAAKRELTWRKASKDPAFFLENLWHIRVPGQGAVPMKLRKAQKEGLAHWRKNRFSLTLKARQIGWTTLVSGYQFWLAFFHPHVEIIDVSRNEDEAKGIIRKTKLGYDLLPNWVRERGPSLVKDNREELEFENGSRIVSKPSRENPARGSSADLVVVDEWAFLPNPEEAWASIEPVADAGGRIIGLSTANGAGNFFHELWVGAETGNNRFKPMFHPWWASENRDQAWYEAKKKELPSWQLSQEYPSDPQESFIRSGNPVFDPDVLEAQREGLSSQFERGDYVPKPEAPHPRSGFSFIVSKSKEGPLKVWERPVEGDQYLIGADTSEGLEHGDYSSAHVVRYEPDAGVPDRVVAHWHGHIDPDKFAEIVASLGWWYNTALINPENNNHGATVIATLRRISYPRIYRQQRLNTTTKRWVSEFGFKTTAKTKADLVNRLIAALRDSELVIMDEATLAELRTFRRDEKGRMAGSPFDDRVISLALANYARDRVHEFPAVETGPPEHSWAWWEDKLNLQNNTEWVIGQNLSRQVAA